MNRTYTIIIIFLLAAMLACNFGGNNSTNDHQATVQAIGVEIAGTATESSTSEDDSANAILTAEAKATEVGESMEATQVSQSSISGEAQAATATAFAPFIAELPKFDVDPSKGRPGWIHPPLALNAEGYHQYDFANEFPSTVAADFVLSADITWDTEYGSSGCGFVMRSDGQKDKGNQYMVTITRGASGHAFFGTMAEGEIVNLWDIYAYGLDPAFSWRNGTTNQLTIVARGQKFTIYTNGTNLGTFDPSEPAPMPLPPNPPPPPQTNDPIAKAAYNKAISEYESSVSKINSAYNMRLKLLKESDTVFERGFIAMVAVTKSGYTRCMYDNAWLWLIEE
jgi:hypothetical protein